MSKPIKNPDIQRPVRPQHALQTLQPPQPAALSSSQPVPATSGSQLRTSAIDIQPAPSLSRSIPAAVQPHNQPAPQPVVVEVDVSSDALSSDQHSQLTPCLPASVEAVPASNLPQSSGITQPQLPELDTLMNRIKALEDQSNESVASILLKINNLALKAPHDFDKYEALGLAQDLTRIAHLTRHEKATIYSVSLQELQARLDKPPAQFKAYFLDLFAENDYSKIIQSLAKVDKALTPYGPPRRLDRPPVRRPVCFRCGKPGHFANRCFAGRYSQGQKPNRPLPYARNLPPTNK